MTESSLGRRLFQKKDVQSMLCFSNSDIAASSASHEDNPNQLHSQKLKDVRNANDEFKSDTYNRESSETNIFVLLFLSIFGLIRKVINVIFHNFDKEKTKKSAKYVLLFFISIICVGYIIDIVKKNAKIRGLSVEL